jgi:hypothetical protein
MSRHIQIDGDGWDMLFDVLDTVETKDWGLRRRDGAESRTDK